MLLSDERSANSALGLTVGGVGGGGGGGRAAMHLSLYENRTCLLLIMTCRLDVDICTMVWALSITGAYLQQTSQASTWR